MIPNFLEKSHLSNVFKEKIDNISSTPRTNNLPILCNYEGPTRPISSIYNNMNNIFWTELFMA